MSCNVIRISITFVWARGRVLASGHLTTKVCHAVPPELSSSPWLTRSLSFGDACPLPPSKASPFPFVVSRAALKLPCSGLAQCHLLRGGPPHDSKRTWRGRWPSCTLLHSIWNLDIMRRVRDVKVVHALTK